MVKRKTLTMSHDPPAAATFTHLHADDIAGIRAAAQLIMAAAGGLVLLVFAGFQFTNLRSAFQEATLQSAIAAAAGAVAIISTGFIARRAALVLVPDRMLIDDLLTADTIRTARAAGGVVRSNSRRLGAIRRIDQGIQEQILTRITQAQGWLLPPGTPSLNALYVAYAQADDITERSRLRQHLVDVVTFARAEAARTRYDTLVRTIFGPIGLIAALSLIGFVALAA